MSQPERGPDRPAGIRREGPRHGSATDPGNAEFPVFVIVLIVFQADRDLRRPYERRPLRMGSDLG